MYSIAKLTRFFIYSYYLRYVGYALNSIRVRITRPKAQDHIWSTIHDYDGDLTIKINPSEHIGHRIFYEGYYEAKEVWAMKKLVTAEDYILDIGANIGAWTLLFSKMAAKGRVYAFEPSKWFDVLQYNVLSNVSTDNVEIAQSGLGNDNGLASIHNLAHQVAVDAPFNAGMYRLNLQPSALDDHPIEVIRLDSWIWTNQLPRLDWIKIDTEGMEQMILLGGRDTILKFRPQLLIEFNDRALNHYGHSSPSLLQLLGSYGYQYFYRAGQRGKLVRIDHTHLTLMSNQNVFCSFDPIKM